MLLARWSKQIGSILNELALTCVFFLKIFPHRECVLEKSFQYSTSTTEAVSVNHGDSVQRREHSRLVTAQNLSLLNGFEQK